MVYGLLCYVLFGVGVCVVKCVCALLRCLSCDVVWGCFVFLVYVCVCFV